MLSLRDKQNLVEITFLNISDTSASSSTNGLSVAGNNSKSDLPNLKKRPKRGGEASLMHLIY